MQSYTGSVLRMEHDQQKLDGANAIRLIEGAAAVASTPRPDLDPGIGRAVDLYA